MNSKITHRRSVGIIYCYNIKFKTIESPIEVISVFKTKAKVVAYWQKDFMKEGHFRRFIFEYGC